MPPLRISKPKPTTTTSTPPRRKIPSLMPSSTSTSATKPVSRKDIRRARLHRPAGASPAPSASASITFAADAPFPPFDTAPPSFIPTPRLKPYLRKLSAHREEADQGRLDLSKSHLPTAGLDIPDTASIGSAPASLTDPGISALHPSQPFIHPCAKHPRPYTPPGGSFSPAISPSPSSTLSPIPTRPRRSTSTSFTSSTPTPLSHSLTPSNTFARSPSPASLLTPHHPAFPAPPDEKASARISAARRKWHEKEAKKARKRQRAVGTAAAHPASPPEWTEKSRPPAQTNTQPRAAGRGGFAAWMRNVLSCGQEG